MPAGRSDRRTCHVMQSLEPMKTTTQSGACTTTARSIRRSRLTTVSPPTPAFTSSTAASACSASTRSASKRRYDAPFVPSVRLSPKKTTRMVGTSTGSAAKVGAAHEVIRQQILSSIAQDDAPLLQHVAAVRDIERHEGVLLHQEDGDALLADGVDSVEDRLHQDRREPHPGIVRAHH